MVRFDSHAGTGVDITATENRLYNVQSQLRMFIVNSGSFHHIREAIGCDTVAKHAVARPAK